MMADSHDKITFLLEYHKKPEYQAALQASPK
jgi:hypothetical protein